MSGRLFVLPVRPLARRPPVPGDLPSQAFLEVAPDAIVIADAAGRILLANHQAEALFGYARAALLGRPVEALLPERVRALHRRHRADYAAIPRTRSMGAGLELLGRRRDGTEVPVEVGLSPLPMGDDLLVIAIIRDVSERRRLEAAERAAREAAEQLKDEFISLATHELRTPLAAIQGFASMLRVQTALGRGPELADWQREAIGEIEDACGRLNALVNDLLTATRIQAGRLQLCLAPTDLVAVARRCVAQLQVTTARHALALEAPPGPVVLAADRLRLEQVLGNLVGNAIKYSPGGGTITVTVRADPGAGRAEVCVRDGGIGIPAAEQARLFQRFARASNVHDHDIAGSGLGLFVCRELVERHGGRIGCESAAGEGATFAFTLPLGHPLATPPDATDGLDSPADARALARGMM